jgi:CRISPR-associated protein Csd1
MEQSFYYLFNPPPEESDGETEDDTGKTAELKVFLDAVRQGKWHELGEDETVRFYILGLSPNAARISVRFWHVSTVGDIAEKIGKHFRDIHIEKHFPNESEYPGMWQLLRETAVQKKIENVSPLLGGEFMRSILTGRKYPERLLTTVIGRFRADQEVNYCRISLVKGCLVRNHNKEVHEMLDRGNIEIAYLLGRLFAVMEGAQIDAIGKSTIRERYSGSASATPKAVFPVLIRLNQHHIAKGDYGDRYSRIISEIMEHIPASKFPSHLPLEDQGLFWIGYYHQRNDLFKSRSEKTATETED